MEKNNKKTMKNKPVANQQDSPKQAFVFGMFNYILMAIGFVLLLIGYILLSGGGSDDPNVFNEEMFNNRRMVVSPILITLGFIVEIAAIMISPKCKCKKNKENDCQQ